MSEQKQPLTEEEVIRSYRDAAFRENLTDQQLMYAANHELSPSDYNSGIGTGVELTDEELESVAGGRLGSISSGSCCSFCNAA